MHQEVIIDDEIIRYRSIGPEGRWDTFQGCERGAWGTAPAEHAAAAECRHYAVDGCINGYILDQEAPLFQQTTSRLAEIFNACDFDMVYFDGSEDVDRRRYHYYSSHAHAVAMAKFTKRPLIHMGGGFTHGLWHSYTRSATVDQYPGTYLAYLRAGGTIEQWPSCKDHVDRSVRNVIACHEELTPGELGWFGIGPKDGGYAGLQFDEIEYLMCKSLAYDAPISLQTSFARLAAHPLTDDILEIVRQYEQLRGEGRADAEQLQQLRQQGQDFVLLPGGLQEAGAGGPAFVAVAPVEAAGGSGEVRALLGGWADGSVATVWHETGRAGSLQLAAAEVAVYDVRGARLEVVPQAGRVQLPLDQRRLLLHFPDRSPEQVRQLLAEAHLEIRPPAVLWLQAEQPIATSGKMLLGSQVQIEDNGALGDVVLCDGRIDTTGDSWSEYRVDIPHRGRWTLWARVRYPTGGDMSFGLGLPGHGPAEDRQVLGNCGVNSENWHWTGRGGGISSMPPGSPLVLDLDAGPLVFRIYPREGAGNRAGNPRLDCFCLAEDPEYRPDDRAARAALASMNFAK